MRKVICLMMLVVMLIGTTAVAGVHDNMNKHAITLHEGQRIPMNEEAEEAIGLFIIVIMFWWFLPCFVCGVAARRKGLGGVSFFILSLICTPLIGFVAVIAMNPKPSKTKKAWIPKR